MVGQDNAKKRKEPPGPSGPSGRNNGARPQNNSGGGGGGGARNHKRAKVFDARSIRSQPADAALSSTGELNLQAFLSAREFEVRALTRGMQKSKAINNRRAFQLVPRGMRRRTASHNVKRMPHRLRSRAAREKDQDETPTVEARRRSPKTTRARIRVEMAKKMGVLAEKRRKRRLREAKMRAKEGHGGEGKEKRDAVSAAVKQLIQTRPTRPKIRRNLLNEPPKPKAKFRKRQIDKTWLPTHLWHVKRAKMTPPKEPLWRFAIPLTPNEKVYRPTHRASTTKGAIMWDVSYMSTIGLYGHAPGIERTLKVLDMSHDSLWDDRGKRWRDGRRKWCGMLSRQQGNARRQIGPATVIWNPEVVTTPVEGDAAETAKKTERQVYIRLHPSCFLEVFNILVKLIKRESPRLFVEDLRFEIGSIELTGPGATEALVGILRVHHKSGKDPHATVFESLLTASAASLPPDSILGFSAQDPRLCYPPRTVQPRTTHGIAAQLSQSHSTAADTPLAPYRLFDRDARFKASLFPSQQALNRRKSGNAPGEPLDPTKADPPFPVLLFSSRIKASAEGTWTLLAPWKCILPIWYSLVHYPLSTGGNPRLGGLDELRQVTFEQGQLWFPRDFPGTDAGAEWELEQRQKRKAAWEKRPKSKRVEWKTLDLGAGRKGEIGIGWACEFERLFGLQQASEPDTSPDERKEASKPAPNAVNKPPVVPDATAMDVVPAVEEESAAPADVANTETKAAKSAKKQQSKETAPHPLTLIHHVSRPAFNALETLKSNTSPPPNALVSVKITLTGRGVVKPCARIYRLPSRTTPKPTHPSTQAEVPATQPPPKPAALPIDHRKQWLAKLPGSSTTTLKTRSSSTTTNLKQPLRFPPDADHQTRKLLLAKSLLAGSKTSSFLPSLEKGGNADHLPVPNEEDLIGYVTKGEFSLADGKGVAIGAVSVDKALESLERGDRHLCIVRDAGQSIGWLARWEVV